LIFSTRAGTENFSDENLIFPLIVCREKTPDCGTKKPRKRLTILGRKACSDPLETYMTGDFPADRFFLSALPGGAGFDGNMRTILRARIGRNPP